MYFALFLLVILIAIIGAISFSVYERQKALDSKDETFVDDFEIIES